MKLRVSQSIALAAVILVRLITTAGVQDRDRFPAATPAPVGFDNRTNGFLSQTLFESTKEVFEEVETPEDGLGPVFNATACADCHNNPVVGGSSQVTERRAGYYDGERFEDHAGGSLIHDRAVDPSIQERVYERYNVHAFRGSLNILGDGFVEAIADSTLRAIANNQPPGMRGQIIRVPVLEANGGLRVGRFGLKNQHASLESFAADAYLNEMGITSPLQPMENTSNGSSVARHDDVPDPEDDGEDIRIFAQFMRSTKAPPRHEALAETADAQEGSQIFRQIGCEICHVRSIVTAPAGTPINGGAFVVPPALGNKIIHPFSDFLLHDIGVGDGIVQNGGPSTMNKVRTAPLWGVRTRSRLMHDGNSATFNEAIRRHKGEAAPVLQRYLRLTPADRRQLLIFLGSL